MPGEGMKERKLSEMRPGEGGVVKSFDSGQVTAVRLREMGLVPGTHVRVERIAPLGDPIEIRLRGYLLSMRKAEAALVKVSTDVPADTVSPRGVPAGFARGGRRRFRMRFGRGHHDCPGGR